MRGEKIYKILDFLEDRSMGLIDFLDVFLRTGYGASMSKLDYEFKKKNRYRQQVKFEKERKRHLEQYIYKLKAEGLIEFNSHRQIKLSHRGKKKIKDLKGVKFLNNNYYKKKKGKKVIIISYDLPVAFNWERDKLRSVLKVLGFNMVHKSVWIGKVRLPTELVEGLEKMHILPYIEILEVTKQGSLKPI